MGWLSMGWLYAIGFVIGLVHTVAGTAAQFVMTQVVAREQLVEARAKNALATSGAEVVGPGWRLPLMRELKQLPKHQSEHLPEHLPEAERGSEWLGLEADVRPAG